MGYVLGNKIRTETTAAQALKLKATYKEQVAKRVLDQSHEL